MAGRTPHARRVPGRGGECSPPNRPPVWVDALRGRHPGRRQLSGLQFFCCPRVTLRHQLILNPQRPEGCSFPRIVELAGPEAAASSLITIRKPDPIPIFRNEER